MDFPNQELLSAMRADPFVRSALDCARSILYCHTRDWQSIDRREPNGIAWKDRESQSAYYALSELLGDQSLPDVEGTANIGGVQMSMVALTELAKAAAG